MSTKPARILHFSDILCVWAYVAQRRLDELIDHFGDSIEVSYHFLPVFGCTPERIGEGWKDRGGYAGFGEHVREVVGRFDHVRVHRDVWDRTRPASSGSAHHFLHAVDVVLPEHGEHSDGDLSCVERAAWRVREAFFEQARDISRLETQLEIADELDFPVDEVRRALEDGRAMSQMLRDLELRDEHKVGGSPTYVLNEGRQLLYGNVGYRIIEANVEEVLHRPDDQASWC